MKHRIIISSGLLFLVTAFLISACQRQNNVCPPIEGTPKPRPALADLIAMPAPEPQNGPVAVEIGDKIITVNKQVDYPLCNDEWSGIVYVSCDAQVAQAESDEEENPLFLKGCNLKIEPGTIVYVAAHNNTAYYKGCSCHTGEDPIP
jgi:hypothetical protein